MSCHKLGAYCRILYAKKGKPHGNFQDDFFLLYTEVTPLTPTTSVYIYIIAWWFYGEWVALAS